jgi:hypothetical protein
MPFVCEPLNADYHNLTQFACGNEDMDRWLRDTAVRGQKQGTGRTFVWVEEGDNKVAAYFTLSSHLLQRDTLGLSRTKAKSVPAQLPAILLGRLALDGPLRGHEPPLGPALLTSALQRCVLAAEIAAARYVVVDAIDDAAFRFYTRFGFDRIPGTMRLVRLLAEIAADLGP